MLLRISARPTEERVRSVLLPWLNNQWCLQEGIQRGCIELDQLPLHSDLLGGFVFWVIKICIKLLDQGYIYVPIHMPGQGFMPASPLELSTELIILCDKE